MHLLRLLPFLVLPSVLWLGWVQYQWLTVTASSACDKAIQMRLADPTAYRRLEATEIGARSLLHPPAGPRRLSFTYEAAGPDGALVKSRALCTVEPSDLVNGKMAPNLVQINGQTHTEWVLWRLQSAP